MKQYRKRAKHGLYGVDVFDSDCCVEREDEWQMYYDDAALWSGLPERRRRVGVVW